MSSESRFSFRTSLKDKIKTGIKSNITSSIRHKLISNETYYHAREKYQNFSATAKNRTDIRKFLNKTNELLPNVFRSKENETSRKGFYDSLFSPQTEDDIYLKVAMICLWIIAILCIIPTIITLFIPARNKQIKTTGVKMIFFHIFLCELFYLIYILLSMINVAQDFQLSTVLCDFANYGMYVTIPVMHFALLFLSIERITKFCKTTMAWIRIFTNVYIIQAILFFIWILCTIIIVTIITLKKKLSLKSIANKAKDIASPIFHKVGEKISSPYQCSIDGRLSSLFKILFIVLFIILIVLIIKSMVVTVVYKFFTPTCCKGKEKTKKQTDRHITLLLIVFLLLNLFFSYPFYFVSMTHSILKYFTSAKDVFPKKLKICFILRLASIILQCIAFSVFESNSWTLLSGLLYRGTCKKFSALNNGIIYTKTPTESERKIEINTSTDTDDDDDDDDDDDVFIKKPKTKLPNGNKSKPIADSTTDDDGSDDEPEVVQKSHVSSRKKDETSHRRDKQAEEESTSKHTNHVTKTISDGKPISQRISSVSTNPKTSKSRTRRNRTKQLSSSSDEISDVKLDSGEEVKPSITSAKKQSTPRFSSHTEKSTGTVLQKEDRPHRSKRTKVSRSRTTTSNIHHRTKPTKKRTNTPRNINQSSEKPKQDRLSKMLDNSDEV